MTTYAQYNLSDGSIPSTNSEQVNSMALRDRGQAQIEIPDGKDGSTGYIDLTTLQYIDFSSGSGSGQ